MRKTFEDYAETAVSANLLFAGLESTAFFVINICIVAILWIGGDRIGAGFMEIGDITALTEYSIMILFYIIMAQMVIFFCPERECASEGSGKCWRRNRRSWMERTRSGAR